MIPADFFPQSVICKSATIGAVEGDLYAAEAAMITRAVEKRVAEFKTGRLLARQALSALGVIDWPLLADAKRCPVWPENIVGSITHTKNFCAVALGLKKQWASIGIDVEGTDRIKENLWDTLFTESEKNFLVNLPSHYQSVWATCFFSAKEAFFKYQFPITRLHVNFKPVTLETTGHFEKKMGTMMLNVLPVFPYTLWHGVRIPVHYYLGETFVFTAILGKV